MTFRVEAVDYLLKPIEFGAVLEMVAGSSTGSSAGAKNPSSRQPTRSEIAWSSRTRAGGPSRPSLAVTSSARCAVPAHLDPHRGRGIPDLLPAREARALARRVALPADLPRRDRQHERRDGDHPGRGPALRTPTPGPRLHGRGSLTERGGPPVRLPSVRPSWLTIGPGVSGRVSAHSDNRPPILRRTALSLHHERPEPRRRLPRPSLREGRGRNVTSSRVPWPVPPPATTPTVHPFRPTERKVFMILPTFKVLLAVRNLRPSL